MAIENLKNHFNLAFLFFFLLNKFSPIKKGWLTLSNIKILLVLFSFFIFWHQILNKVLSTIKLQPTPFVGKNVKYVGNSWQPL
jgi:hypothetical protein